MSESSTKKNGVVIDQIVDRAPSIQFLLLTKEIEGQNFAILVKPAITSCQSQKNVLQVFTSGLNKKIVQKQLPDYQPAAIVVRATGEGLPLLQATLTNAIKKWKFEQNDSTFTRRITIEGKSVLTLDS